MANLHNKIVKNKDVEINIEYLDKIDMEPYLATTRHLGRLMDSIQQNYKDDPDMPVELEENVFNWLDEYDFALYLKQRYGNMKIVERHYTDIYVMDANDN